MDDILCVVFVYLYSLHERGEGMAVKRKYQGPPCVLGKTELSTKRPLTVGMLRQLGLMCLQSIDEMPPKGMNPLPYLEVHNMKAVEKWLLVHVPDTGPGQIELPAHYETLGLAGQHTDRWDWSIVSELGRVSRGGDSKKKAEDAPAAISEPPEEDPLTVRLDDPKCTLESLCASPESLVAEGYPSEGVKLDNIAGTGEGFAIDCEMCLTGSEQVLTRIAVVRFSDGERLLDQLVQPDVEITDYVTKYSGITPEMLSGINYRLADVQAWMQNHIGASDVLIGHSLYNDLNVLRVQHPRVVDTALVFPHYMGPSYHSSLRYLARKFLGREIQTGEASGHDPVEDAATCDRLVKWLMIHGRGFSMIDTHTTTAFSSQLSQIGIKSTVIGPEQPVWDADGTASHIVELDPAKCVDRARTALQSSQFVCATLAASAQLSQQLDLLTTSAPPATLITLCFGSNYHLASEIQQMRSRKTRYAKEFRAQKWDSIKDPWTAEDDTKLKSTIHKLGSGSVAVQISLDRSRIPELPESVRRKVES